MSANKHRHEDEAPSHSNRRNYGGGGGGRVLANSRIKPGTKTRRGIAQPASSWRR